MEKQNWSYFNDSSCNNNHFYCKFGLWKRYILFLWINRICKFPIRFQNFSMIFIFSRDSDLTSTNVRPSVSPSVSL